MPRINPRHLEAVLVTLFFLLVMVDLAPVACAMRSGEIASYRIEDLEPLPTDEAPNA
jgi:hypothetical protein